MEHHWLVELPRSSSVQIRLFCKVCIETRLVGPNLPQQPSLPHKITPRIVREAQIQSRKRVWGGKGGMGGYSEAKRI